MAQVLVELNRLPQYSQLFYETMKENGLKKIYRCKEENPFNKHSYLREVMNKCSKDASIQPIHWVSFLFKNKTGFMFQLGSVYLSARISQNF